MDKALHSLRPFAVWTINGEHEYNNLVWLDPDQTKPTEGEVAAEVARLQAEYEATKYREQRAAEYPPIGDQLDALFHAGVFPAEMAAQIQAVKDKYPKV